VKLVHRDLATGFVGLSWTIWPYKLGTWGKTKKNFRRRR